MASWVSVEHDVRWVERVRKILATLPWGEKVEMILMMITMLIFVVGEDDHGSCLGGTR